MPTYLQKNCSQRLSALLVNKNPCSEADRYNRSMNYHVEPAEYLNVNNETNIFDNQSASDN